MSETLQIDYYSDILCVWAWIAERRNHELLETRGEAVSLNALYLDLFADTTTRIADGWKQKGGYLAFAKHVREAAAPYDDAPVHPDVWERVRPSTSANAHLVLKAAEITGGQEAARRLATLIRTKFFTEALDVASLSALFDLCDQEKLSVDSCKRVIEEGRAIAALLSDNKRAHDERVAGSPTWVLNSGRQILYGNVGYRVLDANVEELLKRRAHEASWC